MSFILNSGRFGGAVDPGLTLLQSATLWLDASDPGADPQKLQNKGTGGSALDARFGSTTGVDTNDPLLLTHTGTNYLYLPGVAGNYCSVPDSAALSVTGDIDFIARLALSDWTPSANQAIVAKAGVTPAAGNLSYIFFVDTTGKLNLQAGNGSSVDTRTSSVAVGATDGAETWVRCLYTSTSTIFYTSSDGSTWTALGTSQAARSVTVLDTTEDLRLGQYGTAASQLPLAGTLYRAQVWSGDSTSGGTKVFDADFTANTNQSSFAESSSNAATVTINRATSGKKAVMVVRPTLLFGTDDYMEIADNALLDMGATDPFTVLVVGRAWGTQGTNDTLVAKKADVTNTTAGYLLANHGTTALQLQADIGDGTNGIEATSASRTAGDRKVWAMVRSVASDNLTTYINTTAGTPVTDTTTATLANAEVLRIGRLSGAGTEYADVEIDTVAVFRSALSSGDLGNIVTYLGA